MCVCVFFLFSWICLPPIMCSVCRFYRIIDNLTLCTDTWMNQINKQISATPVTITIAVTKAKRQALQSDVSGFFFHQLQIYNIILKYTWSYYLTSDRAWNRGFVAYDKKPSVRHGRMCIHEECTFLLLVAIQMWLYAYWFCDLCHHIKKWMNSSATVSISIRANSIWMHVFVIV